MTRDVQYSQRAARSLARPPARPLRDKIVLCLHGDRGAAGGEIVTEPSPVNRGSKDLRDGGEADVNHLQLRCESHDLRLLFSHGERLPSFSLIRIQ